MSNLIPLATAYIRQSRDYKDNAWVVFNTLDEELYELDAVLTPKEAMSYLHFARGFELDALNIGIQFGKKEAKKANEEHLTFMNTQNTALREENERLAEKLLQLIEKSYQ